MSANVLLSPMFNAGTQFLNNGVPAAGGLLYTWLSGTSLTTPATTYTDDTGNTANTNPLVLSPYGRLQSDLWLVSGTSYDLQLTDSNNNQLEVHSDIQGVVPIATINSAVATAVAASLGGYPSAVAITGGTIDGTVIGSMTPAAGTFTNLTVSGTTTLTGGVTANGNLTVNGSLMTTHAAITGGTIDGTVIGGTTPLSATFTNLTVSGTTTLTGGVASNQTWQNVLGSRATATVYQNTTPNQIVVSVTRQVSPSVVPTTASISVSADGVTYVIVGINSTDVGGLSVCVQAEVPPNHYYKETGGGEAITLWAELR